MPNTSVVEPEEADRYLAYIPEHLREKYREGLRDRKITVLHQDIALLDVRIKSLVQQLDENTLQSGDIALEITTIFPEVEPALALEIAELVWTYAPENFIDYATFKRLNQLVKAYRRAIDEKDKAGALSQLFDAIEAGQRTGDLWNEIQIAMEQRRKLVEIEERRIERTKQTLSVQQVVLIVEVIINSIRAAMERYVPDQATQKYILSDAEFAYSRVIALGDDLSADKQRMDRRGK